MKYNIFEIMIALSFICFCFDYTPILLLGLLFLIIGASYVIRHEEDYEYYTEYEEYSYRRKRSVKRKDKAA